MSHKKFWIDWLFGCTLIVMDQEWSRSWSFLNKLIREFLRNIFRSEALFGHLTILKKKSEKIGKIKKKLEEIGFLKYIY